MWVFFPAYNMHHTAEECRPDTIKAFRPLKVQREAAAFRSGFKESYLQKTQTFTLSLTFLLVGAATDFSGIVFLVELQTPLHAF